MRAEDILHDLVIEKPEDISLDLIAAHLGVKVVYERQNNCAAYIVGVGNRAVISVDSGAKRERQRFSIGHELGHWIHDRGKQIFHCHEDDLQQRWKSQHVEARANRFASELLLPPKMFVPLAENLEVTIKTLRELCEIFRTSMAATAIRFIESSSYTCAVCFVAKGECKWTARSEFFPESLRLRDRPGQSTFAGRKKSQSGLVAVSQWLVHADLSAGQIYEDTVYMPSYDSSLSLLWWRENGPIIMNDDEEQWFEED